MNPHTDPPTHPHTLLNNSTYRDDPAAQARCLQVIQKLIKKHIGAFYCRRLGMEVTHVPTHPPNPQVQQRILTTFPSSTLPNSPTTPTHPPPQLTQLTMKEYRSDVMMGLAVAAITKQPTHPPTHPPIQPPTHPPSSPSSP